jgi:two-component system nitrogen regulation response regulator GlnG
MTTALVIDDEPSICWGFQNLLQSENMQVKSAGTAAAGLEIATENAIELVLLDVRLPDGNGLDFIDRLRSVTRDAPIIVMTAYGDLETAITAIDRGAVDYLHKPFRLADALAACQRAIRRRSTHLTSGDSPTHRRPSPLPNTNRLVGQSPAMQKLFHQIALVADSELSVLITGETGTGKELVAAAIHQHSSRRDRPYIPIAPVTYSPSLLESELFGHVKGAFTGAAEDRPGVFGSANGGTILLDEIGDLPLSAQVKLLRVLEQKTYNRVGEAQSRNCDVRILAATHCDLRQAVAEGRFREDLLYRLSGMVLEIPPLRERPEDIELLTKHFLEQAGYDHPEAWIPSDILQELKAWPWPGNVRELKNAVSRAAVVARGRALDLSDFQPPTQLNNASDLNSNMSDSIEAWVAQELAMLPNNTGKGSHSTSPAIYERFLNIAEPILMRAVLEAVQGNRSAAADYLGIHRATLRERLNRYGLDES